MTRLAIYIALTLLWSISLLSCSNGDSDGSHAGDVGADLSGDADAATDHDAPPDTAFNGIDSAHRDPDGTVENGDDSDNGEFLSCHPLTPSQGEVVEVTVEDVDDLPQMVRTAEPHTTFELAPGTYAIDDTLHVRADGVSLRSSTDQAGDVIIDGGYDVGSLLFINSSHVTVAHLTLKRPNYHTIHIAPAGDAEESVVGSLIYGVRVFDAAQQQIKINGNSARTAYVDEGRVECSRFELTDEGRPHVDPSATGCYTGGINAHGARDWVVRNNDFVNIYCDGAGLSQHAVHFWTGSRDTVVEYNRIDNCARGIGFGLRESGEARTYDDRDDDGYVCHYGGVIRNNIIHANHRWYNTGIGLAQTPEARVFHNTIFDASAEEKFSSIDYRFQNTTATIHNNLTGRISRRNDAQATVFHNLEDIDADLFVNVEQRDFRLIESATDAIDNGIELDGAGLDMAGRTRPQGDAPDIGAHEY